MLCFGIAWMFNQGQLPPRRAGLPPRAPEPPIAAVFALAGLGCGLGSAACFWRELRKP